ncbi:pyridoxal phosphate-dependent aminotransferase [Corynebacterium resistens]|uniref:pyridoxal phosphate-dependent aminotransferase n=1 Tax=Corynebacterium resistens TaxID=258224 RepID=UPI00235728C9|nr:pyridoxal phosphate-dependent aminotransferase [Corynebacterium resistens]
MVRSDLSSLPAYVPGASVEGALKLASNESALAPLPSVSRAIAEAAAGINRYPDMGGFALRQKLAECFSVQANNASAFTTDNIALGNGSSALCLQSIQATCSQGDEVIFAWRSFEAYPILTRIAGATPIQVPLTTDHRHDLPAMAGAITDRTRLIFVCNPNNPSGTTITDAQLRTFLGHVPAHVQVVLDEAYVEYNRADDQPDEHALLAEYPNLAVCRTFSKAYGLAGLRLGYMVGSTEFIEAVNKVGIPFGVNALSQAAGAACLKAQNELMLRVEETVAQRARVEELIAKLCGADGAVDADGTTGSDGAASAETTTEASEPRSAGPAEASGSRSASLAVPGQANFVWLPLGDNAQRFDGAMKAEGIVARCFPGEGVRVTVTNEEETERLIAALKKVLPEFV